MYVGMPIAAAVPKHMSCRLVRLNAILVLMRDKSLGTFTYAKQIPLSTSGQVDPKL